MASDTRAFSQPKPKRSKWRKALLWTAAVLIVLIAALAVALRLLTNQPLPEALEAFRSDAQVTVGKTDGGYRLEPASGQVLQPNVIFYPGAFVEPESYAPMARALAESGYRVYIASMPFNLAIFGQNKADSFIAEHPSESYVIGGHSLGGVFAARYAANHASRLTGVYFLASYADDKGSVAGSELSALQITGTNDGILNQSEWTKAKVNLPADTSYVSIEGGNHGQFGTYGPQKGDKEASITAAEQLQAVTDALVGWMRTLQ